MSHDLHAAGTTTAPDTYSYSDDGFALFPSVVAGALLDRVEVGMDAVIRGAYETGRPPHVLYAEPGDPADALIKIDQPQLSNRAILELVSSPEIGAAAAQATGADFVQVWAVQLLHKPPSGTDEGTVGWHQDLKYWGEHWDGELFTAWVAVSDVPLESGAMRYVVGSHGWGLQPAGNFFGGDLDALRAQMDVPSGAEWTEAPAVLPRGGVSVHHRLTIHGSGPNVGQAARRSFAIHLRTDRSTPKNGCEKAFGFDLDDPNCCPVIFSR